MEFDMLIRSALSDAQWLIDKGGTDRAEVLNRVLGKIDNVLKELDGVELIDLNKVCIRRKMLCLHAFMVAIMQICCVCISSGLPIILTLLTKRTALSLRSILKRVRMAGGVELAIC